MMKMWMAAAATAALLGCASRTPEQQMIDAAANAVGGRDRILAVRTIALEDGSGRQFNLGQDMRPGARGQTFQVTALSRRYDLSGERTRIELPSGRPGTCPARCTCRSATCRTDSTSSRATGRS